MNNNAEICIDNQSEFSKTIQQRTCVVVYRKILHIPLQLKPLHYRI